MQSEESLKDFAAPWETFPEIPCGSIGWRMGPGETAMIAWGRLVRPLNKDERMAYLKRHPWPSEWGWWIDHMIKRWDDRGDFL